MIVRDEEQFLPACLESVQGVVDEIVVVDTGSQDSTVAIAERFQARVVHHPWSDDFSAARNQALTASTGQWILALDADERLDPKNAPRIREAVADGEWETGLLSFVNVGSGGCAGQEWLSCRLFRRTPQMRYIGRVHEQLLHQLPAVRTRVIGATVYHYGYQPSLFREKQKLARNARLIELALQESESLGPLIHANYLFYYASLATNQELLRRYETFAAYVREHWPDGPPDAPWITAGLTEHARLLNDIGRREESGRLAQELVERYGESPMLHYLMAHTQAAGGDLEAAERELEKVLQPEPAVSEAHRQYTLDLPLVRGRARFLLGLIREHRGELEQAVVHYQAAVEAEPEQDILRARLACAMARLGHYPEALRVLETSPRLLAGPQPGVDCLGFVLALLARSVARLAIWGEKVQQAAESYRPAGILLERVRQLGPHWNYRIEDFPEVGRGIILAEPPGSFQMPQTNRWQGDLCQPGRRG